MCGVPGPFFPTVINGREKLRELVRVYLSLGLTEILVDFYCGGIFRMICAKVDRIVFAV